MCIKREDVSTLNTAIYELWDGEGEVFIDMLISYMSRDEKEDFVRWYCTQFDYNYDSMMYYCNTEIDPDIIEFYQGSQFAK